MATKIQLRRGTAAQWTTANPTLSEGEIGLETDTLKAKLGDGLTEWSSLSYFIGVISLENGNGTTIDDNKVNLGGSLIANTSVLGTGAYSLTLGNSGSKLTNLYVRTSGQSVIQSDGQLTLSGQGDTQSVDLTSSGISLYCNAASSAGDITLVSVQSKILLSAQTTLDFYPVGNFLLRGVAASSPSTQFFRGDGTWAVPVDEISASIGTTTATLTPNGLIDAYGLTALTEALTIANPSTDYTNFGIFILRIYSASEQAIIYGNKYRAQGEPLPENTTAGKVMVFTFLRDSGTDKYDVKFSIEV